MKKIKVIGGFVVVLSLIMGIILLKNKKDYSYYLVMGDYVSNNQTFDSKEVNSFTSLLSNYFLENGHVSEVNKGYLKNNMNSKTLLEMIEKDSYKIDNSSLVKLIKKSKYITITLGINDVINQIKYDSNNNKLIYDKEIVENKIDIFKHNYHQILEEIKNLNNDAKVLLVGCYNIYGDEELSTRLNNAIKEVSLNNGYYVDVSDLDRYVYQSNELYLTNIGQEEIYNRVLECINEIE